MITTSTRKLSRSSGKNRASRAFGRSALVASVMGVAPLFIGANPVAAAPARDAMGGLQCGGTSSGAGTMEPTGPPTGKIRVANFYLNAKGLPGATLDFYDTSRPSKSDKPLISGLKYGELSAYVSPRAEGPPIGLHRRRLCPALHLPARLQDLRWERGRHAGRRQYHPYGLCTRPAGDSRARRR